MKEQAGVRFKQLTRMKNPDRYTYYEHGSKNNSGGVADKSHGKIVTIINTASQISRVTILDNYLSKVPQDVKSTDQVLSPATAICT